MKRKRVVIAHGGDISMPVASTNRVMAFAKALVDAGFDVYLVIPRPRYKKYLPKELREGIKIHTVPVEARGVTDQIARALSVLYRAKKVASRINATIQVEHSALGGIASILGVTNYVLDVHDLSFASPLYLKLLFSTFIQKSIYTIEKNAVTKASRVIVVSNLMKKFLVKQWRVPEEKIVVIPNGFSQEKIQRVLDKLNKVEERKIIARTGTLFKHLNVEALIHLAKSLRNSDVKVLLIGDGPLRSYIEKRVREKNLKNVIITGFLPYEKAMRLTLKACVVFECMKKSLTTMVACPVKILDYVALGKAMALSDVSEISYELGRRGGALVSSPDDIERFVENVHRLLTDEKLRKCIGRKAKEFVKEYSWEILGQRLVKVYEELV